LLIINADDFGASGSINKAIVESFSQGWCSSATIIPNYPSVEEAFQLVHENSLEGSVGVHLNLVTMPPLTEAIRRNTTFCSDGVFRSQWRTLHCRGLHLSAAERAVVADELRAQIGRCLQARIALTHVDSHTHAHTIPGIADLVLGVAKEFDIRAVRIARNCGKPSSLSTEVYKRLFNLWLRNRGFCTTTFFGEIADVIYSLGRNVDFLRRKWIEIMVHPDMVGECVVDADRQELGVSIARVPGHGSAVSFARFLAYEPRVMEK
jgi:predicted glycoside hydrolase/deacetylase ChbG (UPF0249 family)